MDQNILHELSRIRAAREKAVLALVVQTTGSAPQVTGARLVLRQDGTPLGTVGGGAFELRVLESAREMLEQGGAPRMLSLDLGKDLQMQCGGKMTAYLELLEPLPRLVIFGAGHVGQNVARMARQLELDVWVVDDRPDFASEERFPGCQRVVKPFADVARKFAVQPDDYLLIVTHGHKHDALLLEAFAKGPHTYLGMIGSRTKVRHTMERLRAAGVSEEQIARVHTPVGLSIGSVTPAEIAVSILAQIIQVRRGAPPLVTAAS